MAIEHVNVAKQRRDPNSMLNWTERIIRMRKEVPEVGWGDFKVIATRDPAVLVDPIRLAQQLGAVRAQSRREAARSRVRGRACRRGRQAPRQSAGGRPQPSRRTRQAHALLEAYGYRWYRVGGLDYLLKRSDIDMDANGQSRSSGVSRPVASNVIDAFVAAQIKPSPLRSCSPCPVQE